MANNITLPDGTTIPIPEWATEQTLSQIAQSFSKSHQFEKALTRLLKDQDMSTQDVANVVKQISSNEKKSQRKIDKGNVESGRKVGSTFTGLINKFNQTDRPLSAMVDIFEDMGDGVSGLVKKIADSDSKFASSFKSLSKGLSFFGPIASASMAYAGFVAAKTEQFAKAQEELIDAGAIFLGNNISDYQDFRSKVYDSGISYDALAKTVTGYGVALQSLSNGVSDGTDKFVTYFTALNDSADSLGDFGMRSEEMATAYAEFINVQRLAGIVDKDTINAQSMLNSGFTDLMVETSALAALTGENRTELLKKRMAALSDIDIAGPMKIARDTGQEANADVARKFIEQMSDMSNHTGQIGTEITNAFASEFSATARDLSQFNIRKTLSPNLISALERVAPDFITELNSRIQTGDIEGASHFARQALLNISQVQMGNAQATSDSVLGQIRELQKIQVSLDQAQGNLDGMTDDTFSDLQDKTKKQLGVTGSVTTSFNTLTESFFKAQDALTPSLDFASSTMKAFGSTLERGADFLRGVRKKGKETGGAFGGDASMDESVNLSLPGGNVTVDKNTGEVFAGDELPARKTGGGVAKGESYLVGEDGPEIFKPQGAGAILPNMTVKKIQPLELINPPPAPEKDTPDGVNDSGVEVGTTDDGVRFVSNGGGDYFFNDNGEIIKWVTPRMMGTRQIYDYENGIITIESGTDFGDAYIEKQQTYTLEGEPISQDKLQISSGSLRMALDNKGGTELDYKLGNATTVSVKGNKNTGQNSVELTNRSYDTETDSVVSSTVAHSGNQTEMMQVLENAFSNSYQQYGDAVKNRDMPPGDEKILTTYKKNVRLIEELSKVLQQTKGGYILKRATENLDAT